MPRIIQSLFPKYLWNIPSQEKVVYLTFDDGPIPEVTPWVVDTLNQFGAKGTFFCVGDNIRKYPEVYEYVIENGHQTGNHTFNHLSGWKTENDAYFHNISECDTLVSTGLFRPPYGRIKPSQFQFLSQQFEVVMWDVLSGDFDPKLSIEECYENVINNVRSGSIIVFHDSLKAEGKLRSVLPKVLQYLKENGYTCRGIKPLERRVNQKLTA